MRIFEFKSREEWEVLITNYLFLNNYKKTVLNVTEIFTLFYFIGTLNGIMIFCSTNTNILKLESLFV